MSDDTPVEDTKAGYVLPEYQITATVDGVSADATELFMALSGDRDFCEIDLCPPPLDMSGDEWKIPYDEAMLRKNNPVTIDQFTNEDGDGDFDQMAQSVKSLLRHEFDQNRLTSTEYARTLSALLEATLTNATQFSLQKDAAFWNAKKGMYDAWAAKAQAELLKQQVALMRLQIANQQMEYAQGKLSLLNAKAQYEITLGQRDVTLPKQAESQDAQIALYMQQIDSYKRNAEMQFASKLQDTYTAYMGIYDDSEIQALAGIQPENLNQIVADIATNLGVRVPIHVEKKDDD